MVEGGEGMNEGGEGMIEGGEGMNEGGEGMVEEGEGGPGLFSDSVHFDPLTTLLPSFQLNSCAEELAFKTC